MEETINNCRAQILPLLVTPLVSKSLQAPCLEFLRVPAPQILYPKKCFWWNKPRARVFCLPFLVVANVSWLEWLGALTLSYSSKIANQVVEMNMLSRCFLIMMLKLFKVIIKNQLSIYKEETTHRATPRDKESTLNGRSSVEPHKFHSNHSPTIATLWPSVMFTVLCLNFSWKRIETMVRVSGINWVWDFRCT